MKLQKYLTTFLLLITPFYGTADLSKDNSKTIDLHASKKTKEHKPKKDKHKKKDKYKKKDKKNPAAEKPSEKLTFPQALQKVFDLSLEKYTQAKEKEASIVRNFINAKEVSCSLNEAAKLYESASQIIKENLKITQFFANKEILEKNIHSLVFDFDSNAKRCRQEAVDWPQKVLAKKHIIHEELERLKNQSLLFEKEGARHAYQEAYKQMAAIFKVLIENGEPNRGELAACQRKLAELEVSADLLNIKYQPPQISQEKFQENELLYKDYFFHGQKPDDFYPYAAIPLDGQKTSLYLQQFYRYLVRLDHPARHLGVKVFENDKKIHEEIINIPIEGKSWEHYLVSDEMLLIPKTSLCSNFGLDLQLSLILDPDHKFSLIISQKGSDPKYKFSFFLDGQPLYDIHFIPQPPWQLETLCKPKHSSVNIPTLPNPSIDPVLAKDKGTLNSVEEISQPYLDLFIKEMKKDPFALAQYVHNEIELVDPFLFRDKEGVFQAPSIHRNPLKTFLEKQGSPWEQCMLLVYLLKHAGFQTQYIEGTCSLPASYVEKLLFMQFPEEQEILLNYPGVMFFDGKKWYSLFPWMKEIHTIEGHDIYSLMPEEYGNAERWLKQYLCNDENILKHIGSDENDTVGVLFIRHLEECLRNQGLSLQDVGTHRVIQKKQFNAWEDFPRPFIKKIIPSSNLPNRNEIFANFKITFQSEQNPLKKIDSGPLNLSAFSMGSFGIYFTPLDTSRHLLHFFSSEAFDAQQVLALDASDTTIRIDIVYETHLGPKDGHCVKKSFSLVKGTCAALCLDAGSANAKVTSIFAERFIKAQPSQEKFNALLSFIGAAYFEKCNRSEKQLAALHKIAPCRHFCIGLSKLSPDPSSPSDLRFPQVDMFDATLIQRGNKHPFSPYQEPHLSYKYYATLVNADGSSNEHQVLREIYQDPYAISTVKLLQIAHQNHKKKKLPGLGFLIFTSKNFDEADATPELARFRYFPSFTNLNLQQIKTSAKNQWEMLRSLFKENDSRYTYAYMTPGPVSSLDGYGLKPPSYTGIGTLINSSLTQGALISDGSNAMNGGYGSKLPINFVQTVSHKDWQLISNGNNYSFLPKKDAPLFTGEASSNSLPNTEPILQDKNDFYYLRFNASICSIPVINQWVADVRQDLKSVAEVVGDPVDVITGAFYVDEVDLNLPGPFPLEIRRNYSSKNSLPGLFGFGWKLSLNPTLYEEGDKLFAAEKDGSVIVYRYAPSQKRWIVLSEDNPELKNYNQHGIGSTANPFHAYIEKGKEHILYGADGSKRVFHNNFLKTWSDHAGNALIFSYENERLKKIENSSGGFLFFEYNHGGKISEAYVKDGRRISYNYDSEGNLASVTLPNNAVTNYEYDRFHRIIRETKPHGHVLENIYKEGKVVEQRSPVGRYQHMVTSASFAYTDGLTVVTDPSGGTTEYKIYKNHLYKITDPEGHQTLQSWFLDSHTYFDAEAEKVKRWDQSGAYPNSLKTSRDKRGLTTSYLYDNKGNVLEISLSGEDLTSKNDTTISKHFHYNTRNLCTQEETLNTNTITHYDSRNPYLIKRMEKYVDDTLISFIDLDYTSNGLLSEKNQSGAITQLKYDSRNFLRKKIQKTGTNDPDVITNFLYNDQGQCVDLITTDAIQHNEYDIMGNQFCSTVSLHSGKIISKTYAGYDLNNNLVWKQGNDPQDTLFLDYNAAGLLKVSQRNLSQIKESSITSAGIAYTLYEYDTCCRLIENVDPLGNSTYYNYDALGRMIETTKNGLSTKFTYEPGGLVASTTMPSGATTINHYTTNGLLKSKTCPDGSQFSFLYDFFGRVIQEKKNGITSTITYNDAAHEKIYSEGEFSEICKFDACGNLILFTDRAGYTLKKTYDGLNRLKTQIAPNGDITTWNYQGDTIVCTMPNGESTIQRYEAGVLVESKTSSTDGSLLAKSALTIYPEQSMSQETMGDITVTTWTNTLGLPIRIQQGKKITHHHYDPCGNCISKTDEEGNTSYQEFDPSGRLIKKILPDGAVINYDYDADSNLITYNMPENLTWKATYDSMGYKRSEWQESKQETFQRWEYLYKDGHLIQVRDPLNRFHDYEYDSHARLKKESVGKYTREYTYDPRGFFASVTESGTEISKVERTHDELGRIIKENIFLNGTIIQNTRQIWTPSSRSLQIGEHKRDFQYQGGRLRHVSTRDLKLSYDYSLSGSLTGKITPFSTSDIRYNDSMLPETIYVQIIGKQYYESLKWNPSKLASHHSSYPNVQDENYAYTSRGYLQSTQNAQYTFDFGEPGRGIRTAAPNLEVPCDGIDEFERIAEENSNSTSINTHYDDRGQVIIHHQDELSWDPWGRIIAIKNDRYEWTASYDALGRRIQTTYTPTNRKQIVTNSFYDPEHEFQEIGVTYGGKTFWKIYGLTSCDAIIDSAGAALVLHHDMRSNLQAVISKEQTIWNTDYPTPFGPIAPHNLEKPDLLSFALSLTWQSKQVDPTGLIWLGARYYDPLAGRFLSPDPISHPLCLDLYAYANGDPINNADLDGRFSSSVYNRLHPTSIDSTDFSLPTVTIDESFEEKYSPNNRSRRYDLSDFGRPELPHGLQIFYLNGINTEYEYSRETAIILSDLAGGYNIQGIYGATISLRKDLDAYFQALDDYVDTGRVRPLHSAWDAHFDIYPDVPILQLSDSRGTVDVRNALLMYPEERGKKIINASIAPGGYIFSETCAKVTHYRVSWLRDYVPYHDSDGAEREKHTIVKLESVKGAPLHDHSIRSPTYRKSLKMEIQEYIQNYGIQK